RATIVSTRTNDCGARSCVCRGLSPPRKINDSVSLRWMDCVNNKSQNRSSLQVRALEGTHELVVRTAQRYVPAGSRALDLGAWSGGLTKLLLAANFRVTAADLENVFQLPTDFVALDFN